ncbi:MAG TPA: OmpA family protein [Candidatus Limnocylindria bacterium]|nr:OmpA family protein [Candidatus Limnocylindria bacterium]
MRKVQSLAALLALVVLASGCTLGGRKWGSCAVAGGVIGATAGGITGGALVNNLDDDASDGERGGAIAGGIVGGGLLGALLGHVICDPLDEPVAQPAPVEAPPPAGTQIGELKGAHFAFDSARLTAEGEARLADTVATLKQHPDLKVVCNGYTDSIGSEAYNMRLGQRRADAVRDYLVSQGIDASRIRTESFGESNPVASNDTEAGRAENRRVEIVVE